MHLEHLKLGSCFQLKHGFAFKGEFFSDHGPYIVTTPGNFFDQGGFKPKSGKEKFYTGPIPEGFVLSKDDLIVAMTEQKQGLLGSSALIPEDNKYLHNQRLGLVTELNEDVIDKRFLYYLFNTHVVRDQIQASANGAKVRHTSPTRIYDIAVTIPDVGNQRRIASILATYDDLIENNTRRIEILEEMAKRLYEEWFVRFRFPGHEEATFVASELGQPEGWESVRLDSFGPIITGKTPSKKKPENYGSEVPFLKLPDMHGKIFAQMTSESLSALGEQSQPRKTIPPNSLCVSCIGTAGIVVITSEACQTNQQINSLVPDAPDLREFLYFALKDLRDIINLHGATGATMTNLSKGKFSALEVTKADDLTHARFHAFAAPIFDQILNIQRKNTNLRAQRDLLLPKLISGQIDVSKAEEMTKEAAA